MKGDALKRAPLWIGIPALWLTLGTLAGWLLLTPDEQPTPAAKPEIARLDEPLPSECAPGAFPSVAGDLKIAKGRRFEAKGFNVIASYMQTDDSGEFVP